MSHVHRVLENLQSMLLGMHAHISYPNSPIKRQGKPYYPSTLYLLLSYGTWNTKSQHFLGYLCTCGISLH